MNQLIPHFILEKYSEKKTSGSIKAFAMFIDLSGFTKLTNHIMKKGTDGAEELSIILNNIFEPLVSIVYERGGFIPYFAGDAFTAIFPKEKINALEVLGTADLVQELFKAGGLTDQNIETAKIKAKIGISFGKVNWGIIGNKHKTFYFKGPAIDGSAACQVHAFEQEIIVDKSLTKKVNKSNVIFEKKESSFYKLTSIQQTTPNLPKKKKLAEVKKEFLKDFFPENIIAYNQAGEIRNVVSVFISFEGVGRDKNLSKFINIILEAFYEFSGYFKEIDFGDKGGVVVGFFGAPITFENNISRALECVLSIQENIKPLQRRTKLRIRIGITSGLAYTGIIGGLQRNQYAAVGNAVNLAARQMMYANWGEILVNAEIGKERNFGFNSKGEINFKGIDGLMPTYQLIEKKSDATPFFTGKIIGRDKELKALTQLMSPLQEHKFAGVICIYGEAGIGKSRVSFELKKQLQGNNDINWFICQADQILQKPFNPFIYFFKKYFKQSLQKTTAENRLRFEHVFSKLVKECEENIKKTGNKKLSEILKEVIRTKTIIAWLIGLHDKKSLWSQLDALGRYRNTLATFINLILAECSLRPTVIELEDAHWFDNNSKAFIQEFSKSMREYPILILISSRYLDDGSKPRLFEPSVLKREAINYEEFDLNILSSDAIQTFASGMLEGEISEDFLELLLKATNGNPFYLEQLLEYFLESGLLELKEDVWHIKDKNIKLSSSINAILMARIDRLSTLVKETVKAAAVIGREFEVGVLSEVMQSQKDFIKKNGNAQLLLREQIKTAEKGHIWQAVNELRYIFKHSLLREAVYDMQLRTQLRELHRLIAQAIEKIYARHLEQKYADLAFHYEEAGVVDKMNFYLEKVANFARRNYQNQRAIRYYIKLLNNLEEGEDTAKIIKILFKKGSVQELVGNWERAEEVYKEALELAREFGDKLLIGRANNSLGNTLTLKGKYEEANMNLQIAAAFFEDIDDEIGKYKVYGNLGNVNFRQGLYEKAKKYYLKSLKISKAIHKELDNFRIASNLGLTFMNLGEYKEAIKVQEAQLKLSKEKGQKLGVATTSINLGIIYFEKGDYDKAMKFYKKGLSECKALGDRLFTSIAIGGIGSVYERKGDYKKAMKFFEEDLEISFDLGDKQGISIGYGLIGDLYVLQGNFDKGLEFSNKNLKLCRELNYQKGTAKALSTIADAFFYQKKYVEALRNYDEAIDIAKVIKNQRVLTYTLLQKTSLLLETGQYIEAKKHADEALIIAEKLGNDELLFNIGVLEARVSYMVEPSEKNKNRLLNWRAKAYTDKEKAAASYGIFMTNIPEDRELYQKEALVIYELMYEKIPKYLLHKRIQDLIS